MGTSFIERVLVTLLSVAGFALAAAYLHFRCDGVGIEYAGQLSGATAVFVLGYMAWYRGGKPKKATISEKAKRAANAKAESAEGTESAEVITGATKPEGPAETQDAVETESGDEKIPLQLSREKLREIRATRKGRREFFGGTAIALLAGAIIAGVAIGWAQPLTDGLVLGVGLATAAYCWFHFDHRADDKVTEDKKAAKQEAAKREAAIREPATQEAATEPAAKEAAKKEAEGTEKASETQPKSSALSKDDPQLDLLRLEYTKGAERYENIYRAIWQNFSYLSVVSAGILTFGGARLSWPVLSLLALTPICFWYLATFLPMDYYGQEVRSTLSDVQDKINVLLHSELLHHFGRFASYRYHWRVRDPVRAMGTVFTYLWLVALAFSIGHLWHTQFKNPGPDDPLAKVIADLRDLRSKRDTVDSTIGVRLDSAVRLLEQAKTRASPKASTRAGVAPLDRAPRDSSAPAQPGNVPAKPTAGGITKHGAR